MGSSQANAKCLDADRDRRAWVSSVAITAVAIGAAIVYALRLRRWLPQLGWFDLSTLVDAGHHLWIGAWGSVYRPHSGLYDLPPSLFVIAPLSGLLGHLHSPPGHHLVFDLFEIPYLLAFTVFLLHAVRRLAWELGVRQRLWAVQAVVAVLVVVPELQWGHFEDVLALTCVIHCVRRLLANDVIQAALLLSVAVSFKQWAVALVPFLVFAAPPGFKVRTVVACSALPVLLVAIFAGVGGLEALHALFLPANTTTSAGHAWPDPTWAGPATGAACRTLAVVLAAGLGWFRRRALSQEQILVTVAAILLVRPLLEAVNLSYYWSPALVFALLATVAYRKMFRWVDAIWPVATTWWLIPLAVSSLTWWAGQSLLLIANARMVARAREAWRATRRTCLVSPVTAPVLHRAPLEPESPLG
jgi:hypothetical protein